MSEADFRAAVASWQRIIRGTADPDKRWPAFVNAAREIAAFSGFGIERADIADALHDMALANGWTDIGGVQMVIADALVPRDWNALETRLRAVANNGGDVSSKPANERLLDCDSWWRDPATIPPRAFLYKKHYARRYIGASIGAGGRLKTSYGLFEAIEMAMGRDLTTKAELPGDPLRVAFLNAEEDQDEIDRRVAAICLRYNITKADLGERLFVTSTRGLRLRFATMLHGAATLNQSALDQLHGFITRKHADVFMLDPWVSFHAVRESENADMDLVIKDGLGGIADATNSAGEIFHHPGKPKDGKDTTVEDARGASAILYAVRSARAFNFMASNEADQYGLTADDRRRYIRISNGKANMGATGTLDWLKIEVEKLSNGDEIACPSRWKPPDSFEGVSTFDMRSAAQLARKGQYRADPRAKDWFGWALAEMLRIPIAHGLDNDAKDVARVKTIIKTWLKNKVLKIENRPDEKREKRPFIAPGPAFTDDSKDEMEFDA